jgi:hypothetical protein
MKLNPKVTAITLAILWGGCVLLVAVLNRVWPSYGGDFLSMISSIYPGYHVGGLRNAAVGTCYALLDGAIIGGILAWVHNKVTDMVGAG